MDTGRSYQLGIVLGFADLLAQTHAAFSGKELEEYLLSIANSARKMNSIIEALLLLAGVRSQQVEVDSLEMGPIVDEVLQRQSSMIETSQAEIILPDTWPTALGYGPWVEEVWANYISNAIKYGGRPPRVELGGNTQTGDMARFWVRDNGPGVPLEKQGLLFAPPTRLDRVRATGHGLGLSIVRRIVSKLGGQVGVESELGKGSSFFFTLPVLRSR